MYRATHIIDQFIWGRKVSELSVGPPARPPRQVDPHSDGRWLAPDAIAEMRARAATLGEKIRQEEGVNTALQLISENFPLLSRDFPGLGSNTLK